MAKTDFQLAVEQTAEVSAAYEPGLRALRRAEVGKVVASDGSRLDGSLNIDDAVAQLYPNENRWGLCHWVWSKGLFCGDSPCLYW